jgi:hypothetical protein
MSTKAELELKSALLSTGLVQPVESNGHGGSVSVVCRQVPGQDKPWLQLVAEMLAATEGIPEGSDLHICRRYFVRDGKLVFGWHISFAMGKAKAAEAVVEELKKVLSKARPVLTAVEPEEPRGAVPVRPRAPARPAQPEAPSNAGVRRVENRVDEKRRLWQVDEMPLPHVNRDLNTPTRKGRGARGMLED